MPHVMLSMAYLCPVIDFYTFLCIKMTVTLTNMNISIKYNICELS